MRSGHLQRGHVGGGLHRALNLRAVLFAVLAILIARPLDRVALLVQPEPPRHENLVIAFFWIRGGRL
jgi:hypothetical protein